MIVFLLANWRWLIPTAIAGILGIWLGATKIELADLHAEKAKAAQVATEIARQKDAENIKLAAAADKSNMEKRDALDKADSAARDLARTHGLWLKASRNCLPNPSANPGSSSDGAAQVRLDDETANALISIARDGDRAAVYAQTCHQWAITLSDRR